MKKSLDVDKEEFSSRDEDEPGTPPWMKESLSKSWNSPVNEEKPGLYL
jgi:hypothetical protein